ncbi:RGS1-HXK1-interacting protein 1 isoform X1 [Beta vulgaris subsp. vulgaris]|uniref:RGS1-HXK1-interacting protein 1 isoform X1 n=1 Tax=Beta vulgaris subsp. vulgaris TaxID=3555 RepID=UPI002036D59B|nr:RGS1-HXK1-interacting protein 1 isoform X1 [Beta vulgaris subsp. vulgaris]
MEKGKIEGSSANAKTKWEDPTRQPSKPWHSYISDDLPRSFMESADAAIRSACSLHHDSSTRLRFMQDLIPEVKFKFSNYEEACIKKFKDGLATGLQHPTMTVGITLATVFLLMRGPRRFLFHHTVGRLQSEEAQFVRAEKSVKMLELSVDLMKKESRKLLERASLAEKEMINGQTDLMNAGKHIRHLAKSVDQVENQAADLVDLLREIPGREALQLRAQVASVASLLKQQRTGLAKRKIKLTEMGVPV